MHHLPRQFFGGKVHLLSLCIQFNRSILQERERGAISFVVFSKIMREAEPAIGYAKRNLVCADFYNCVMPAVESVDRCIGAEQRCPGGPKFGTESTIQLVPQGLKPQVCFFML